MTRRALTILLAISASGCIRGNSLPPLERYRLQMADSTSAAMSGAGDSAGVPLSGRIAVSRFETPGIYGDENIVYRIGESEYGAYGSREWALPLGDMLGIMAEKVLRRHHLAQDAVFEPRSREQFAYQWRGSVRQFEEVDEGSTIHASVHLEARLIRASDDSLLWHGDRLVEITVTEHTMPQIVSALSEAAQSALEQLTGQAKMAVQQASPASGPPNP